MKARIVATGRYLPKRVLTNSDLEKMVNTSDEWIIARTGIQERRIAAHEEFPSDMGLKAAEAALQKADIQPQQIDLILVATSTPDYPFPSVACLIQEKIGAKNAAALDFQVACTGYLYGLGLASSFIEAGQARYVLLVASEKLSSIVDYQDRTTCILFGDGAAAALLSNQGAGLEIVNVDMGADGSHAKLIIQPAGGSKLPASLQTIEQSLHYLRMEGKEVFKQAVRRMLASCKTCLARANVRTEQLNWIVTHQANIRIIEAIAKRLGVAGPKVYKNVHKYGNTSAPSVGIALDELLQEGKVEEGHHILLAAFGAGLTWGSCLLKKGGAK